VVYSSILNVMMWIVAFGLALVVGSSIVLLYKSLQNHGVNANVQLPHIGYDEFYDASDKVSFEKMR
jgi:hypothetical protein